MRKIYIPLSCVLAMAAPAFGVEKGTAASSANVKRFEKLIDHIGKGCRSIWPDSESLRKRCVNTELDSFNLALREKIIDVGEYLKTGVIRDAK